MKTKKRLNLILIVVIALIFSVIIIYNYNFKKTYISCKDSYRNQYVFSWNNKNLFLHELDDSSKISLNYEIEESSSKKIKARLSMLKEKKEKGELDLGIAWNDYIFIDRVKGTVIVGSVFDDIQKKDRPDFTSCIKIGKNDLTKPKF